MKKLFISATLGFAALSGLAMAAPEYSLKEWSVGKTIYGEDVTLEDLGGQAVVISYWSAGMKEGAKSIPILAAAHRRASTKGLVVIAAEMQQLEKKALDLALGGKDPGITITRGARGPVAIGDLPHSFVFDPQGGLLYSGSPSDLEFESALNLALGTSKARSTPPVRTPSVEVDLIPIRKWVNSLGKDVTASVIEIQGDEVVFRMKDGRKLPYPVKKLSKSDRELISEFKQRQK